jgi:hypothetical protein
METTQIFLDEASLVLGAFHDTLLSEATATLESHNIELTETDHKILSKYFDVVVESAIDGIVPDEADIELTESDLCLVEGQVYLRDGVELEHICEASVVESLIEAETPETPETPEVEVDEAADTEQINMDESALDDILASLDLSGGAQ